jgi:hypothetical protein
VRVDDELTALVDGLECVEGFHRDLTSPPGESRRNGLEAAEQLQFPEDPGWLSQGRRGGGGRR